MEEEDNEEEGIAQDNSNLFVKEIRLMLFGFGDEGECYEESVQLLQQLTVDFIIQMSKDAIAVGTPGKLRPEDIIYLIRNDPRMFSRVKELLQMNEQLKKARKEFEDEKFDNVLNDSVKNSEVAPADQ